MVAKGRTHTRGDSDDGERRKGAGAAVGLVSRVAMATAVFAAVHSAFASRRLKVAVYRRFPDARAFYRIAYNAQAAGTFGVLVWLVAREPKVTLYHVKGPLALLMRLGQMSGLALALFAARATGIATLAGLDGLPWSAASRRPYVPPAAQGPEVGTDGRLRVRGPFTVVRHPLNLAPLMPFWLTPQMTSRRLAFNVVASIYLVIGSIHEEARLVEQYGAEYEQYRRSGVPFYLPRFSQYRVKRHHQSPAL